MKRPDAYAWTPNWRVRLHAARIGEDAHKSAFIDALSEADLAGSICYRTVVRPTDIEQERSPALDHFFNHQTHHRGQAHVLLSSIIGKDATPSFDLIIYDTGQGGLRVVYSAEGIPPVRIVLP